MLVNILITNGLVPSRLCLIRIMNSVAQPPTCRPCPIRIVLIVMLAVRKTASPETVKVNR